MQNESVFEDLSKRFNAIRWKFFSFVPKHMQARVSFLLGGRLSTL